MYASQTGMSIADSQLSQVRAVQHVAATWVVRPLPQEGVLDSRQPFPQTGSVLNYNSQSDLGLSQQLGDRHLSQMYNSQV